MSNYSNIITLTQTSSGTTFDIGTGNIIMVIADPTSVGGSQVTYRDNGDAVRVQIVNELPANINTASGTLVRVTDTNGTYFYINPAFIVTFDDFVDGNINTVVLYNYGDQTAANRTFKIKETVGTLETEIAAVTVSPTTQSMIYTNTTGITAHAGGGQGSATTLTTEYNNVTTCATAGDSVVLLTAAAGTRQIVKNNGAQPLAVFANTGDKIDGGSLNGSITLLPGDQVMFSAIDSTDWESSKISSDEFVSGTTGITAHAGGGQGSATALITEYNNVTTCATHGDSVVLLTPALGITQVVDNNGAASCAIYPPSGCTINGGAANSPIYLAPGGRYFFFGTTATNWNQQAAISAPTDILGVAETDHNIKVRNSSTAATAGGKWTITSGDGTTTGAGGAMVIAAGSGGNDAVGGDASLTGGAAGGGNRAGGVSKLVGGAGAGTQAGGVAQVTGGVGGATGAGGPVTITSGAGGATSGNSGGVTISSGNETGTDSSGNVTISSGTGASAASGNVSLTSGAVTVTGDTGTMTIGTGNATSGTSGLMTIATGTGTTASGNLTVVSGNATTTSGTVVYGSGTGVTTGPVTLKSSNATTTAGALTISTGTASTTGGIITVSTGNISAGTSAAITGTTGTGTTGTGAISWTSGNASAGGSGAASLTTGTGTTSTGGITLTTGNASAGTAGNIVFTPGTTSSTTVSPIVISTSNLVKKPLVASVASGGTITGKQLVDGNISGTGGTGNWTLPDTSAITTAIGATPAGTTFDFTFTANGMTAGNVATLVAGANMVILKQTSSGDSATNQLMTITNTSNVNVGIFRIVFDTATTCVISRIG